TDIVLSFSSDATVPASDGFPGGPTLATVPAGTVIEVVNEGRTTHRLQGDTTFDTGLLRSGEHTTVVLTNDAADPKHLDLTDLTDPAVRGSITVQPKHTP